MGACNQTSAPLSTQPIPNPAPFALHHKVAFFDQRPEMLFQRIAAGAGDLDHVADADATVLSRLIENLNGQFRQIGKNQLLALDFLGEPLRLLLKRAQEK